MGANCMTPPMDATPVYEEVYETNIADIVSGMGPCATQPHIPSPSPGPRRGSIQGRNINIIDADEVSTVHIEFMNHIVP